MRTVHLAQNAPLHAANVCAARKRCNMLFVFINSVPVRHALSKPQSMTARCPSGFRSRRMRIHRYRSYISSLTAPSSDRNQQYRLSIPSCYEKQDPLLFTQFVLLSQVLFKASRGRPSCTPCSSRATSACQGAFRSVMQSRLGPARQRSWCSSSCCGRRQLRKYVS
jgi:hypothetical protein